MPHKEVIPPLVIRADAGPQIGMGHLMRCLALAEGWHGRGGKIILACASAPPQIERRLRGLEIDLRQIKSNPGSREDALELIQCAHGHTPACVVVDGYHFDQHYQRELKQAALRLLAFDDCGHTGHYWADWVLNQNPAPKMEWYKSREPSTVLLLGNRYTLLRGEFLRWREWERPIPAVARKLLVTLGGSDPANATMIVLKALQSPALKNCETVIVAGPANAHIGELADALAHEPGASRLVSNPENMPELMAGADLAVAAGGTTCWELAFMGLPALVAVLAGNQRENAEQLEAAGVAVNLGAAGQISQGELVRRLQLLLEDAAQREAMSRRGRALIDGEGVERVLLHLLGKRLRLRPARAADSRLLWEWANDPETRAWSFSSNPIPWEEHEQWFTRKLADARSRIYLAVDADDAPVGQIRFDLGANSSADLSVSLAKSKRGRGLGYELIRQGLENFLRGNDIKTVHALVKSANAASLRAFQKCGFQQAGLATVQGHSAWRFVYEL